MSKYSNNNNKPRRFTQCNTSANRPTGTIAVLDPTVCRGLLHIPVDKTLATRGRDDWLSGKLQKDLSLCTLFQKGRCHAHNNCFQVHVDQAFIATLREEQATSVSCCQACGDTGSLANAGQSFLRKYVPTGTQLRVVFPSGGSRVVDQSLMAYTEGLSQQFLIHHSVVEGGVLEVPVRRVCRLHMKSFCKYGKDCKNVHLCCKMGEKFLVEPPVAAAPVQVKKPVEVVAAKVEEVAAEEPKPIPCFRVPSFVQRLQQQEQPTIHQVEDSSQDSMQEMVMHPSFKFFGDASQTTRLRKGLCQPLVFDAEIALEDSKYDQSVFDHSESVNSNSSSGVSVESLNKPSESTVFRSGRRLSTEVVSQGSSPARVHYNPLHPCRLNPQDMQQFVSMFE